MVRSLVLFVCGRKRRSALEGHSAVVWGAGGRCRPLSSVEEGLLGG
ncbi:hypothetical protein MINT15_00260 [Saccharomonospora viridis]|uniref:Uncharacterized protein n=1 Tax=Saccharomonospora viridis TaxID=1852 RepID=A0A837DET5_9PSEU|nr:hypothetical protein MINT15_00260 [Saccharomonospora viridis]